MTAGATVFVVDDDPAVRDSLRMLLKSVHLRSETFASAQQFLDQYDPEQPGCLLLDVRLPGMSGPDLMARLSERQIKLPTIIITGHGDVPLAVRAMKSGALDFLEKPFNDQMILEGIQRALKLDADLRNRRAERSHAAARLARLTPGERAVLDRMVVGEPYKVIATALGVSYKTVEARRARIMAKLQAKSLAELVRLALIVAPEESAVAGA
ncbi:MAG: response regulator [Planctomycetota bacterium]